MKLEYREEIRKTMDFLYSEDAVFELTGIKPSEKKSLAWEGFALGNQPLITGYFNDRSKALESAVKLDEVGAEGIYVSLNETLRSLLGRADNRLRANTKRTKDDEVVRITNFLIDVDPVRPSGISSNNEELQGAMQTAVAIRDYLKDKGWPWPLRASSGNGAHLIYKVNLPRCQTTEDLIKRCLAAIGERFGTDSMKIDQTVCNPGRLVKLYGTIVRKGDKTPDRPHRRARIRYSQRKPRIVPEKLLHELAAEVAQLNPKEAVDQNQSRNMLDVPRYLRAFNVPFREPKRYKGSTLFPLEKCLFNSEHQPNEASIGQADDGVLFYQCFHNSCKHHTWSDARLKISGTASIRHFFSGNGATNGNGETAKRFSVVSAAEIAEKELTVSPIINGLLDPKDQLLIFGAGGIKKSMLTLDIAFNLASPPSGGMWNLFKIPQPINTLFVQSENGIINVRKRIDLMIKANPRFREAAGQLSFISSGEDCRVVGNLMDKGFQAALKELIYQTATSVLVIDPLISFHAANENDNVEMRKTLDVLTMICDDTHTSAILVHHAGKSNSTSVSGGRGASAIGDWAPNILLLEPDTKDGAEVLKVIHLKSRNYQKVDPFRLEFGVSTGFRRIISGSKNDDNLFLVVKSLEQLGGKVERQDELMEYMKKAGEISKSSARRIIKLAVDKGLVEEFPAGKNKGYRLTSDQTGVIQVNPSESVSLKAQQAQPKTEKAEPEMSDTSAEAKPGKRTKKPRRVDD